MLLVIAEVRVKEGAIEQVRDAVAVMEQASREEPGCRTYAFSLDISDPTMVRITERWDSMADLEAHFRMPHMADFGKALSQIDVQSMDVKAYEVGSEVSLPV